MPRGRSRGLASLLPVLRKRSGPPPRAIPEAPLDYALAQGGFTSGNQVTLLHGGGEAFPAMLDAIAHAEREVLLESYIVADDATGHAFLDALGAAARRGVDARLICDGYGSLSLPPRRLAALEAAGGHAMVYRPLAPWRRHFGVWRRDHRKLLAVDRRIGFVGGVNLSDEYDSFARAGDYFRDLHLAIEGPAVAALAQVFETTWNREEDRPARRMAPRVVEASAGPVGGDGHPAGTVSVPVPPGVTVQIAGGQDAVHRSLIRRSFLHAVKRAQRSVTVANAYFIPDRGVTRALCRAARRGVDVRVLVPARSDVLMVDLASRAVFPKLLSSGVRIAEWSFGMLHAKVAAVDGRWATVGSYNLDRRSMRYNLEVNANVLDRPFASALEDTLRADFDRSHEIELPIASWSLWLRMLATLAYLFRAWL